MIAPATNQERVSKARVKLATLKQQGFRYIVTQDDGDTWIGSENTGLEIDEVIDSSFMGEVRIEN